jgi:hypothetical protein
VIWIDHRQPEQQEEGKGKAMWKAMAVDQGFSKVGFCIDDVSFIA